MRMVNFTSTPQAFKGGTRQRVKQVVAQMSPAAKPLVPTPRDNTVLPLALYEGGVSDARHQDCHRGHLIALEFGGREDRSNLVPMYGSFNSGGVWRNFENELATWVDASGGVCEVTIVVDYPVAAGEDERVPTKFTVTAKVLTGPGTNVMKTWPIAHPKPAPAVSGADAAKKAQYLALRDEMEKANWHIELHLEMDNFPSYRKRPVFSAQRSPYAFLDYAAWKAVKDDATARRAWSNAVVLAQASEFSAAQIATVRDVNRVLNDGLLMSDDPSDPVYTDLKYRIPGQRPGLLVEGGHDLTPQVDHVIAKSVSGAACFSNAMLISAKHNSDKRARVNAADQASLDGVSRGTGRPKKPSVRYKPF